ncbi:MAG: hypothetical protein IKU13_07015, partial [Clostridia bacterium]|nr:hypothetical protein [Clostridia bacterium]
MMKEKIIGSITRLRKHTENMIITIKKAVKEEEGAKYMGWLLASFLASNASIMGTYPFGTALVSAFAFTNLGIVTAFGAALGYVFFMSGDGLCYMGAVLVMVSLGVMTARESRVQGLLPLFSAVAIGLTSGVMRVTKGISGIGITTAEMLLTAFMTFCFSFLRDGNAGRRNVGRLALYITFILFFGKMHLFGIISIARCMIIFAIFIYMYAGASQEGVM